MEAALLLPENLVSLNGEVLEFTQTFSISRREADVLRLLLSGVTAAGPISKLLDISPHTVNNHLRSIYEKTGTSNKTEIVAAFVRFALSKLNSCRLFAKQPKVMILDDEAELGEILSAYLEQKGIKTFVKTDPMDAMVTVREECLDFIVCDVNMPKMNGMTFLREVRRYHRRSPMVIMITGDKSTTIEQALGDGAISFLPKPLNLNLLFFTIMEHFIEGTHEKSRLLRIDSRVSATLEGVMPLTITNIGYGGAFLPVTRGSSSRFSVGDRIAFSFQLEPGAPEIKAEGEVVWRREIGTLGAEPGVGVKFTSLDDNGREAVEEFVRINKIASFIPFGAVTRKA